MLENGRQVQLVDAYIHLKLEYYDVNEQNIIRKYTGIHAFPVSLVIFYGNQCYIYLSVPYKQIKQSHFLLGSHICLQDMNRKMFVIFLCA